MAGFFLRRNYPPAVVDQALQPVRSTSRDTAMLKSSASNSRQQSIPLALTYHPINVQIKTIMTRNFDLLRSDSDAKVVFQSVRILCLYRRNTNLRDSLARSSLSTPMSCGAGPRNLPLWSSARRNLRTYQPSADSRDPGKTN